jgi:hypothetical protein
MKEETEIFTTLDRLRLMGDLKCVRCKWYFKDHLPQESDGKCRIEVGRHDRLKREGRNIRKIEII